MEHEGRCVGNHVNAYTSDMDFHGGSKLSKLTYPIKTIYSKEARVQLRKVMDDFQPDVCHLNNFNYQLTPSMILEIMKWRKKTRHKCKIVFTAHDYQLVCPNHSSIFVHTEKGGKILEAIKSHIEIQEEDVNSLVTENGVMVCNSAKPHPRRAEFYQLAEHYPIDKALNKIDPITLKDKIIEKSKRFLFKTGLITVARHLNKGKKVEVVENK